MVNERDPLHVRPEHEGNVSDEETSEETVDEEDYGDGSEEDMLRKRRSVTRMQGIAKYNAENSARKTYKNNVVLAASVSFWVVLWGLPMYNVYVNYTIFGQRGDHLETYVEALRKAKETAENNSTARRAMIGEKIDRLKISCGNLEVGRMRNLAEIEEFPHLVVWNSSMSPWSDKGITDVWCGFLPRAYATNWPSITTFIYFTVYKTTGNTVRNAFQGIVGVFLAGMNMHVMSLIFPSGARGYPCVQKEQNTTCMFAPFVVVSYSEASGWSTHRAETLENAMWLYNHADQGGLKTRVVYRDGKVDTFLQWYADDSWVARVEDQLQDTQAANCEVGTIVYDDPNYGRFGELACLFDVALVLGVLLLARAPRPVMMFGLSWTVNWMMAFMNPAVGVEREVFRSRARWAFTEYFVTETTAVLGCTFAVLATFVPRARLQNLRMLFRDAMALNYSITSIWQDAAVYLAAGKRSAQRYQIETQVDSLDTVGSQTQENVDLAWWETFDLGRYGKKRILLGALDASMMDTKDMLRVVKASVIGEDFLGNHGRFWSSLRSSVNELIDGTSELMWLTLRSCRDGHVDETEQAQMDTQLVLTKQQQSQLVAGFHKASPGVSRDLSDEYMFVFALSYWARRTTDFADDFLRKAKDGSLFAKYACCKDLREIFALREIVKKDHVLWAARNFASLFVCFLIGYYCDGSIFSRYDATMASTLSVLMVAEGSHHVEYEKAARRLVGVSMGKSLPFIITSLFTFLECGSMQRTVVQAFVVASYVFCWTFVYYSSPMWSYVACLIGGLGISGLVQPCAGGGTDSSFAAKYKEIGSVTVAILIQAILHTAFNRRSPQDMLKESLAKLQSGLTDIVGAVFAADIEQVRTRLKDVSQLLNEAKLLVPECDPTLELYTGPRGAFKIDLCKDSLCHMEDIVGEFNMLSVAATDWAVRTVSELEDGHDVVSGEPATSAGVLELFLTCPSFPTWERQMTAAVRRICEVVPELLFGDAAELASPEAQYERKMKTGAVSIECESSELDCAAKLYEELSTASRSFHAEDRELTNDIRVRLTIVARTLENVFGLLFEMEQRCIKDAAR